jgi:hypothetical protein
LNKPAALRSDDCDDDVQDDGADGARDSKAVVIAMMPLIVLVALTTLVNNGACDSEKGKKKG